MAFWQRLNRSRHKFLSHQFRRCYVQCPYASLNYITKTSNSCPLENPILDHFKITISRGPINFGNNVRFFAISVQAKTKKEEKDSDGPRLNGQITAHFIRLVTDEGHGVVPLREALEQARKHKLDLVEVNRKVDPPVCKIMDFHREMYKRQVKEKDRAKSQSELTIRKGDCKEVRFSAKTEQKDLKMKADSIIRLMQRGYRVKCMATGTPKKGGRALKKGPVDEDLTEEEIAERRRQEEEEEKEELNETLSRLTALIEDECIIESGPRVEKKQAYVIVRHAKFGPSKKGGNKKLKDVGEVATAQPTANHSSPVRSTLITEKDTVDPNINFKEDLNGTPKADHLQMDFNIPNLVQPKPVLDSKPMDRLPFSPQPSVGIENRYKRSEPRQQFPPSTLRDSKGPDKTDSNQFEPRFSPQNGHPQSEISATTLRDRRPVQTDSSAFRNRRLPPEMLKQPNPPSVTTSQASSFGIFSSPKASTPGQQGVAVEINNKSEANRYNSGRDSSQEGLRENPKLISKINQKQGDDGGGQARWGIFSRDGPNVHPSRSK